MKKFSNEIMTGIMILFCALILIFLTVKTLGSAALKKGYNLNVQFGYAAGLKTGAPVYLTGVEVGEVKTVKLEYPEDGTRVIFSVEMDKAAKVREDSQAYIATMGLMGEKYLELSSGSKDAPFLKSGSMIIGKEPLKMEEVMDKAMTIADNLNDGIGDLRKLTQDVDSTLTDNRDQLDGIIKNMNDTSKNFKDFSEDIKNHPWKLLIKTKENKDDNKREKGDKKGDRT